MCHQSATDPQDKSIDSQRRRRWSGARALVWACAGATTLALVVVLLVRPAKTHQPLPPGLRIESDTLDLGTLTPALTATGTFKLSNRGTSTYRIEKIAPECGCTVVRATESVLPPKATLHVPVMLKGSAWGSGRRTKRVLVQVKDDHGITTDVVLNVTAAVEEASKLALIPGRVDFQRVRPGEVVTIPMFVRGDKAVVESLPAEIKLNCNAPRAVVVQSPKLRGWRVSREILLSVLAPDGGSDPAVTHVLEIVVNGGYEQRVQIPVRLRFDRQGAARHSDS